MAIEIAGLAEVVDHAPGKRDHQVNKKPAAHKEPPGVRSTQKEKARL